MTNFQKILVNGKEVDPANLQALPEAVQQVLADKNKNGVPDFLEGIMDHPFIKKALEKGGYTSFEQLPPEMKDKLQGLMQKLGGVGASPAPQVEVGQVQVHQTSFGAGSSPVFSARAEDWKQGYSMEQPGQISMKTLFFAVAAILGLLIFAFAAWMFFAGR